MTTYSALLQIMLTETSTILVLLVMGIAWLLWRHFRSTPKSEPTASAPIAKDAPQVRHVQNALAFAKTQHGILARQKREQEAWQEKYAHARAGELDRLSGIEFEAFLAGLFRMQGYQVELTATTGDYGADLILAKDGKRIAVQAKRHIGSVGVSAVQEALSGQAYYQCDAAWVVTTGTFTTNARELATKSGARLIGRSDIVRLMPRQ